METMQWRRRIGLGQDLVGTRYAVRWSQAEREDGELVNYKREWAVVYYGEGERRADGGENLEWYDTMREAKERAETLAAAESCDLREREGVKK